jgi:hypothetical protein
MMSTTKPMTVYVLAPLAQQATRLHAALQGKLALLSMTRTGRVVRSLVKRITLRKQI